MEKGVCFLDIDGVVNNLRIEYRNEKFYTRYYNTKDKKVSNEQALLWISKLCIENKLDIVITSTWRIFCNLDELKNVLYSSGLIDKVNIGGVISTKLNKIHGIKEFLMETDKYVIIDDESYSFKEDNNLTEHLVSCDPYSGFGVCEYEKATNILKNKTLIKK